MVDYNENGQLEALPDAVRRALPPRRLATYARLWQFETWLREMVYLELRARYGDDWSSRLRGRSARARTSDERLTHMPTRERYPTSYLLLNDLLDTISRNWYLFKPYLPPKRLWGSKLEELGQIRHRVAHFRRGHTDDLKRVEQLLRDLDKGFWRFCTSYNDSCPIFPQSKDRVIREFLHLDPFPWGEVEPGTWMRLGTADPNLTMSVSIEILRRPWLKSAVPAQVAGKYGYLYNVTIGGRNNRCFDYSNFLKNTKSLHNKLCHICLTNSSDIIRVTIPTILGESSILTLLKKLVHASEYALRPGRRLPSFKQLSEFTEESTHAMDTFAQQWPEYVLGPSNPLTFLDPEMPCSFFDV